MLVAMVRWIALVAVMVGATPAQAETLEGKPDLLAVDVKQGWVFAVGRGGEIWSQQIKKGEWQTYRKTTQTDLLSVSVVSRKDVWVVGIGGMFIHYDGEDWLSPGGSTSATFRAVLFKDRRKGIALGDKRVRHFVRDAWDGFSAFTETPRFRAVARVGRGRRERLVAVGDKGIAVSFSGVGASLAADLEMTGTDKTLVAVDGCPSSKSEAVAVGAGAVHRGVDGTWSALPDPPETLSGVAVQCKRGSVTRVFATGAAGLAIYDAAAGAWSTRAIDGATALNAIDWVDNKRLIVVGDQGFVAILPADEPVEPTK